VGGAFRRGAFRLRWAETYRELDRGAALLGDRYVRRRFEDVFADRAPSAVHGAAGLKWRPALGDALAARPNASRPGRFPPWDRWPEGERRAVLRLCAPLMAAYGDEDEDEEDPEPADGLEPATRPGGSSASVDSMCTGREARESSIRLLQGCGAAPALALHRASRPARRARTTGKALARRGRDAPGPGARVVSDPAPVESSGPDAASLGPYPRQRRSLDTRTGVRPETGREHAYSGP